MNYLNVLSLLGVGGAHPGGLGLTKAIFELEPFSQDEVILDVGCGTGQTVYFFSQLGYNITGIDYDDLMIKKATERSEQLKIIKGTAENLPFPAHTFDRILCESTLSFTEHTRSLSEIYRVLKKNGHFIAIEMMKEVDLSDEEENELKQFYHFTNIYTEEEWKQLFSKSGFTTIKIKKENHYTIDLNEPVTELSPSQTIPAECFDLLNQHEQLTKKYKHKLSYRIFQLCK